MKIDNRQQILAIGAIGIVGIFLLDRVVVTPLTEGWKERSRKIAELEKSIRDGKSAISRESALRQRWSDMKTNTLLPESAERTMLEAFQRWSGESGISVSSILPTWKRGQDDDEYSTIECHANASGSVGAMAQFIYSLEKDPMALRVESLEVTARDESGKTLAVNLQVSGLVLGAPPQ